MHLWTTPDEAVKLYRESQDELLGRRFAALPYRNPDAGNPVDAAEFLSHVDALDSSLGGVVYACYPAARRREDLRREAVARLRMWAWATLKGHDNLHSAYQALRVDGESVRLLGFDGGLPSYETLRCLVNERLTPDLMTMLQQAVLADMKRLRPSLGRVQVQDCTPHEALRRDDSTPYNPHYQVRMHRLELRWDAEHAVLLDHQFYHGNANESRWLNVMTGRLGDLCLAPEILVVDNGYAGFANHAYHGARGIRVLHRNQESWCVDEPGSLADVQKRYASHWKHPDWRAAPLDAQLRFLYQHGSDADRQAVGRYLRDTSLTNLAPEMDALRSQMRAQNEGLNAELKQLPLRPQRGGALWLLRRALACTLTLFLVQWTRLRHGATKNLCRTAYIV